MIEDEMDDNPTCPKCGGPGVPMGALGELFWYRCRNCGWEFTFNAPAEEGE